MADSMFILPKSEQSGGQQWTSKTHYGEGGKGDGAGPQKLAKKGKELKEDMDALVDEIAFPVRDAG